MRVRREDFVNVWVKQTPAVHGKNLLGLKRAFTTLAHLTYDNPLHSAAEAASYRRVRQSLAMLSDLLEVFSPIEVITMLNRMASSFLRGFYEMDGELHYRLDENLYLSPLFWSIATLEGRPVTVKDVPLIKFILGYHVFLAKFPMDRDDLEASALESWLKCQLEPDDITADRKVLLLLRSIVNWLIDDLCYAFPFSLLEGAHGPGVTATTDSLISNKESDMLFTFPQKLLGFNHVPQGPSGKQRANKRLTVRKDVKSLRSITAEPPENQFLQQGVKDLFYAYTDKKLTNLGNFVTFSDQEPSRLAALKGSRDGKTVTLDLKEASDRVSVDLVAEVFSGDILFLIMATRSWNTLIDEDTMIELNMFGGMGSALTFPVQTTLFTAVAILGSIISLEGALPSDLSDYLNTTGPTSALKSIRVYGDDMVVPAYAAQTVIKLLGSLGLRVNVDKSFLQDSPVREACGIYALGGWDITPLRYRVDEYSIHGYADGRAFEQLRAACNLSFIYGYKSLYKHLVTRIENTPWLLNKKSRKKLEKMGTKRLPLLYQLPGEDLPIGILSEHGSNDIELVHLHERVAAVYTYTSVGDDKVPDEADDYHYRRYWYRESRSKHFEGEKGSKAAVSLLQKIKDTTSHGSHRYTETRVTIRAAYFQKSGNEATWRWALQGKRVRYT